MFNDIQDWWAEFRWKNSQERVDLARKRVAAHEKAMREGGDSPYRFPEKYPDLY